MEDERFAIVPFVLLDFPKKNNMITAIKLSNTAADKMGCRTVQQWASCASLKTLDTLELVCQRG